MSDAIMPTYSRLPIEFDRGEGAVLWDTQGGTYLDALGGIAVCALGHAHPAVSAAIEDQARRLIHTSNLYGIGKQGALADKLVSLSGMDQVFFSNSGAEANEAAIKVARRYGHGKGIEKPEIIVMDGSFHGRTLATLTATGNRKVRAGFEPLVPGFIRVPYNDIEAVRKVAENSTSVAAILVEPITGEGGIRIPDEGYLETLRAICDEQGWLLMLDEIQTGMGRTGHWFAWQGAGDAGVRPDVMTLAKALGNGVPIGACVVAGPATGMLQAGNHGSTFGGNPLSCAAALAVIETMESENLLAKAARDGDTLLALLRAQLADVDGVTDIRGRGLMIGVELDRPCPELVLQALDRGLLINVTAGNVIRLLPPYILSDAQIERIASTVSSLVLEFLQREAA
ncbi:MAG: aspartate aminotransferase family protein [Gammaproteobacteria bacterium]